MDATMDNFNGHEAVTLGPATHHTHTLFTASKVVRLFSDPEACAHSLHTFIFIRRSVWGDGVQAGFQ